MSTTIMAQPPRYAGTTPALHRKPVANPGMAVRSSYNYPQQNYPPVNTESLSLVQGHSRSRTTSSGVFPMTSTSTMTSTAPPTAYSPAGTMHSSQYPTQYPPPLGQGTRRTLSNATASTTSTSGTPNRSNSGALHRSSSQRSGTPPSSYVALMRKQKATVWCDRAQYEDPRILVQQRQAKMRANMEVAGGHHVAPRAVSSSSSVAAGVRSKIRHHGAPKASLYAPGNLAGTGVPMRLSASEIDEGDSEDNGSISQGGGPYHQRSGSGRSSLGSGRRMSYSGRLSSSSTPPNGNNSSPTEGMGDLLEEETPVQVYVTADYFEHTKTGLSGDSGSSGERNFGHVGQMPQSLPRPEMKKGGAEDLHRRGSVDERTTTMSNTRLFIANPDADSD